MRKAIILFLGLTIYLISCDSQSVDTKELLRVFLEYRDTKSIEYATTGQMVTSNVREYMHNDFYTIANNPAKKIIILDNNFSFDKIRQESDKYYSGKYGKNCYWIEGSEKDLGIIENNKIKYYEEKKSFPAGILFVLTEEGPRVLMEGMFDNYYILEKDVPVLLDRLKRTGAKY